MAILYKANETDFSHLGLGPLNDAISILVTEERNGVFELEMKYPVSGKLFKELKNDRIIKADAGHKLKDQRFKIIRITKPLKGIVTVYAEHVSYLTQDLALKPKVTFTGNARQALEHWKANLVDDNPFTVWSDISTTGKINWTIDEVENARRALGGVQGSILDVYGGEYLFDNYDIYLYQKRGVNSELLIAYGRNLVDLEQEEEIANTYTSIYPYSIYTDDDGNERMVTLPEYYIDSEHVDKYARRKILVVDFTNDEIKTVSALRNAARRYIIDNDVGVPRVNLKIQYIDLAKTLDYKDLALYEEVNLCDNVMIYFEKYDINTTAKVIKVVWDVLNERYDSIEVGEARASLSQAIDTVVDGKVHNVEKLAMQTLRTADGKNTIYFGLEEPLATQYPLKKNDIWYRIVDGEFTRTYRYDGVVWQLIIDMDSQEAKAQAQQAKDEAQQAVDRANQATQQATNAINQAQTAFDEAQLALTTVTTLQGDVVNLSTLVDNHTGQISAINQSVAGLQTQVSDIDDNVSTVTQTVSSLTTRISDAEGNITTLQQTSSSLASRLADAEGNITTLTATVSGLQTTVSDIDGHVSSLTQLSTLMQARLSDAEGNINTLTQTASSLQSTIKSVRDDLDGLEISEINLISNSNQRITSTSYLVKEYFINEDFVEGEVYTVIIKGDINEGQQFGLWQNRGSHRRGLFDDLGNGLFRLTFDSRATTSGNERRFRIYNYPSDGVKSATIEWIKFVRGNKTSLNWSPAPEDMATQSQITQLSDAINLRVAKGDVLSQINIEAGRTLIDTDKLVLSANTTHVTGDFKIDGSAHIKDASIGTAQIGTIDAAIANIINISANSIVGGILQSQNDNITFDLNNSVFNIRGGGQFNFIDPGNGIRFQRTGQTSGMVLDTSAGHNLPMVAIGISPSTSSGGINANHSNFRGLRVHSKDASHHTNLIDYRFIISELPDLSAGGFVFQSQFDGSRRRFFPMNTAKRAYDLGTINNRWTDVYADNIKSPGYFTIQNTTAGSGFRFDTTYQDGAPHIYFRGLSTGSYYYAVGAPGYRFRYIYLTYEPDVSSDKRLKTDITNNELGLDFINDISTKIFRMKSDRQEPLQFGILAQDLKVTLEHHGINTLEHSIVRQHDDGYYGVQATQLIFPTIKAVQELDLKVESVKDDVEWLKLENQYLRQKIEQLEEMIA